MSNETKPALFLGDEFTYQFMNVCPMVKVSQMIYAGNCKVRVIDKDCEYYGETLSLTYNEAVKAKQLYAIFAKKGGRK